eukprot:4275340-Prymnesium_polylepis.1
MWPAHQPTTGHLYRMCRSTRESADDASLLKASCSSLGGDSAMQNPGGASHGAGGASSSSSSSSSSTRLSVSRAAPSRSGSTSSGSGSS